jgi:hypothetical protein
MTQCADPLRLPLSAAKVVRNNLNEKNNHPPPPHWDRRSDIAKPYQIYVNQLSCADVNSPYINESVELTQWYF